MTIGFLQATLKQPCCNKGGARSPSASANPSNYGALPACSLLASVVAVLTPEVSSGLEATAKPDAPPIFPPIGESSWQGNSRRFPIPCLTHPAIVDAAMNPALPVTLAALPCDCASSPRDVCGCAAFLDPSQRDRLVQMAEKNRRLAGASRPMDEGSHISPPRDHCASSPGRLGGDQSRSP